MKVTNLKVKGTWRDVADCARTTIGMIEGEKEPSSKWKKQMLQAEHSPIRTLVFNWKWIDLPYWVSVHLVRHKFGIEHFVSTQRSDRTGVKREDLPQGALVQHRCEANAQTIINISRKRMCIQASKETREAWMAVVGAIDKVQPEVASCCVPECIYRGFCPELKSCGWINSESAKSCLDRYHGLN
jgi:hypothetical protein